MVDDSGYRPHTVIQTVQPPALYDRAGTMSETMPATGCHRLHADPLLADLDRRGVGLVIHSMGGQRVDVAFEQGAVEGLARREGLHPLHR